MKIYVTSLEGRPVGTALEATFGEAGGSIGRSDTNTLILPDLQRVISRVHARIEYRGGGFVICNVGSNPITVRGRALAQGETVPLFAGDELVIGSYTLTAQRLDASVTVPQPAVVAPQPAYVPPPAPAAPVVMHSAPPPVPAPPPAMPPVSVPPPDLGADPLGLFGSGVAPLSNANPFADLMGGGAVPPPAAPIVPASHDFIPPTVIAPPTPAPAPAFAPAPASPPLADFASPASSSVSPLAEFAAPSSSALGASPFAEFAAPDANSSPLAEFAAPAPMMSAQSGVIPDDFDPFADPLAAPPVAPATPPGGDFDIITGTQPAESRNIDALYGLGAPSGHDPFANSALAHDLLPQDGQPIDPLVALGAAAPKVTTQTIPDQVAEIHGAFIPPAATLVPEPAPAPPAPPAPAIPPASAGEDMFFSWEPTAAVVPPAPTPIPQASAPIVAPAPALGPGDFTIEPLSVEPGGFIVEPMPPEPAGFIIEPIPPEPTGYVIEPLMAEPVDAAAIPVPVDPLAALMAAQPSVPAAAGLAGLGAEPLVSQPVVSPVAPVPVPAATVPSGHPDIPPTWPFAPVPDPVPAAPAAPLPVQASNDPLIQAFLVGLGMPNAALPLAITPEFMQRVGVLLREATQGTLDLLMARAMTKREVRADATIIVSRNNNPLKFSPDVAVALTHLVAPQGRGFLSPEDAMRDAYEDLRSHQFGFMAGLRAALADVLKRFDPAVLEQRLTRRTMLDSMLAINRRAKLWDLYTELYREIASEAEEDFHSLFGREFVRAYEEQVSRLKDKQG